MRSLQQFWTTRRIGEDRVTLARLGPLRLWLARAEMEWGYAEEQGELSHVVDIAQVPEDVLPDELDWTTVLFRTAPREFQLRPVVPDRPVVIKPLHPVTLPAGEAGRFFALIPVFVELVFTDGGSEHLLGTVASRILSDTWFGTPTEGEFAYSIPFPASRDFEELERYPHHIICPVEIENHSRDHLVFEKICLRPAYLSLYCGAENLWSNPVEVRNESRGRRSLVRYPHRPPEEAGDVTEVAVPQERAEKGLQRFTFGNAFSKDILLAR